MTTTVETFACHDCQLLSPSAQRMPAARLLCRIRLPLQHASPVLLHPSHSWHRHHEGQTIPVLPGPHWHGLLHLPLGKKHHLHLCLGHRLHLGTLRSPPPPSHETPIGRLACCVWPRRALVRPTAVARCAWQCACTTAGGLACTPASVRGSQEAPAAAWAHTGRHTRCPQPLLFTPAVCVAPHSIMVPGTWQQPFQLYCVLHDATCARTTRKKTSAAPPCCERSCGCTGDDEARESKHTLDDRRTEPTVVWVADGLSSGSNGA